MLKRILATIITIILVMTLPVFADDFEQTSVHEPTMGTAKGKVIEVISETNADESEDSFTFSTQIVKVKVLTGKYKGEEFIIENNLSNNVAYDIKVQAGDEVVLAVEETEGEAPQMFISDFVRDKYMMYLLIAFILLLLVVGRIKGLKSMATLAITVLIVAKVMLPLILKGYNPIWVSIVSSIAITILTIFIIGGINIKSISAIIGTAGGVIFAAVLSYIVGSLAKLTGLSSHEASMLMYIPQGISFDFRGLLFAGIIIGTLGAVMDVGMSIASAMYEMRGIHPNISPKELIKSGLNVGRDVMGTMSNTLILAYTGSAIPLLLLFMAYDTPMQEILNLDLIATEIVRSLAGSIGIIIAIPTTALVTGLILKYKNIG
ncbi:YibE/F family protein [Caldisalinibacter kiritimatiensis]|uniref:Putative membrane protein n=1 Tax=Caldisalinibacter kiritimatiensis TaxID=1304284 RepID=R1ASV1_9FIRM|nr:YibE/F family protein [Caldisalinibacter kiritimatiensis]EOD00228.1 putative membrane protein [Caldisalinibacter kiritimatiensis]